MKKMNGLFLSLAVILMLAACGQSDMNNEELDNNAGGANEEINEETDNENNNEGNNLEENGQEDAMNDSNNLEENANEEPNDTNAVEEEEEQVNEEANVTNEEEIEMINSVTLYFSDNELMEMYRVESDMSVTKDEIGALDAMKLWAAGPNHDKLYPLIPEGTSIEYVEFHNDVAHVSFTDGLNEANLGSSGYKMLTEQIALMLEQFDYDQTQIMISGEVVGEFQGHMDLSEPIQAGNPEEYQWME